MSVFVVTETGVVVEYPTAGVISWDSSSANSWAVLYQSKDGNDALHGFVARVPKGCIPSFGRPTTLQTARNARDEAIANCLEIVEACLETMPSHWKNGERLASIKKKLERFDARSNTWKTK